jgi:membrane protein DedA with SNARE-associated domain
MSDVVAPRSPAAAAQFTGLLVLGLLQHHLHGPSVDYLGIALAAGASWIGVPGPGEPVLIAAGIYAARGKVDLGEVLAVAWLGATLGGSAGWLLGRRGGRALWSAPGPLQRPRLAAMERGERFFDRYGLLAIYLMPSWVAGINAVPAARFMPANALFALGWTLLVGGGAYLVGPAIEDVVADLGLAGGLALAALILGGLAAALLRRRRGRRARDSGTAA